LVGSGASLFGFGLAAWIACLDLEAEFVKPSRCLDMSPLQDSDEDERFSGDYDGAFAVLVGYFAPVLLCGHHALYDLLKKPPNIARRADLFGSPDQRERCVQTAARAVDCEEAPQYPDASLLKSP
jgi:hypothetical protein